MSTNCSITALCADGKYRSIYCHWDGYVNHAGKVLTEHYTDQKKIDALMELGDLIALYPEISCPEGHSSDTPVKGYSIFFMRDGVEDDCFALVGDSREEVKNKQQFNYFWDGKTWVWYGENSKADMVRQIVFPKVEI